MAYIGRTPLNGQYKLIDTLAFDGTTTAFTLQSGSVNIVPQSEQNVIIHISGVYQIPNDAYLINGSTITFTSAPLASDTFTGLMLGDTYDIGVPSDATVTASSLASSFYSLNNQTFTDLNIPANKNAMVAGSITVSGTLTIGSGSTLVIV